MQDNVLRILQGQSVHRTYFQSSAWSLISVMTASQNLFYSFWSKWDNEEFNKTPIGSVNLTKKEIQMKIKIAEKKWCILDKWLS